MHKLMNSKNDQQNGLLMPSPKYYDLIIDANRKHKIKWCNFKLLVVLFLMLCSLLHSFRGVVHEFSNLYNKQTSQIIALCIPTINYHQHAHGQLRHQHEHFIPHEHFVKPGLKQLGHCGRHSGHLGTEQHFRQLGIEHRRHLGPEPHFRQLGVEHCRHLGHLHLIQQQLPPELAVFDFLGRRRVCRIFLSLISVVMFSISWTKRQRWRM